MGFGELLVARRIGMHFGRGEFARHLVVARFNLFKFLEKRQFRHGIARFGPATASYRCKNCQRDARAAQAWPERGGANGIESSCQYQLKHKAKQASSQIRPENRSNRSGRLRRVFSSAFSARQRRISSWLPLISTSGTAQPRKDWGRV